MNYRLFSIVFIVVLWSCSQIETNSSESHNQGGNNVSEDSFFTVKIIEKVSDSSIINNTKRTIDLLVNGVNNYLGGSQNDNIHFKVECLHCQPVQYFNHGLLFGKRLFVSQDSIVFFKEDLQVPDSMNLIERIDLSGERVTKQVKTSHGRLTMNYQGQFCNDTELVAVELQYDDGDIRFKKLVNASYFEFVLNQDGIKEQYLIGCINCSQEMVWLRINSNMKK